MPAGPPPTMQQRVRSPRAPSAMWRSIPPTGRRVNRYAPPVSRAEISERQVSELDELGIDYWWFAVRLRQVRAALREFAPPPGAGSSYLDLGCGAGATMEALVRTLQPRRSLGLDGTDGALSAASARGLPVEYANLRAPLALPFAPDVITALDVLEHLEDDVATLRHLAAAAAPRATLIVTVPAFRFLWSRWDDVSGHRRRYDRTSIRAALRAGGWEPLRARYFLSFALPPAWLERRVLRRVQEFEFPRVPAWLDATLQGLGRLEQALGNPLPFGTSLLTVARRSAEV